MDKNAKLKDLREQYSQTCARIDELQRDIDDDDMRAPFPHERRELDRLRHDAEILLTEEETLCAELGVDSSLGVRRTFRARPSRDSRTGEQAARPWVDVSSGREIRMLGHGERLSRSTAETSVGALVAALIRGPKTERERRALSSATGSAGGYTVDEALSADFIDLLRARLVIARAGAMTVEHPAGADTLLIARLETDPVVSWRNESGDVEKTDAVFAQVKLSPRSIAAQIPIPVELLMDSANLETALERALVASTAAQLDKAALYGSGVVPEPLGVSNTPLINAIAHDATLTNYAPFVDALQALADDNADIEDEAGNVVNAAAILAPRDRYELAGLTATDNQPLVPPEVVRRVRMLATTLAPVDQGSGSDESTALVGDFRDLLLDFRQDVTVEVLKTTDYANKLQVTVLVHARFDSAVARPGSFCAISGIKPT